MNCTNIKISMQMFKTITEVGRMMKSTFIVYDPENTNMELYGFNGTGYEWNGETKLGCMKYIDHLEYIDAFLSKLDSKYPVHGFVCYVKDLYAASKLLDESNPDNNEITLMQCIYSDNVNDITSINVKVDGVLSAMIPTFKLNKFKEIHNRLIKDLNTVDEIDITDDNEMIQLLSMKAADGAQHLLYHDIPMYLTANMLNVNKGDRIIASHTDEINPRVLIKVVKKKYTINTIFKILSL